MTEKREEASRVVKEWKGRKNTAWTGGSRLDDKRVGGAALWWEETHTQQPWRGKRRWGAPRRWGETHRPLPMAAGRAERRFHLGKKSRRPSVRSCSH